MSELPFADPTDAENADRGFVAALTPCVVRDAQGRVVYDGDSYGFLTGDRPSTVDRSLWRQSGLCTRQGLYEVTEGIYQVRGLDISNMTPVEGDRGVVVVDQREGPATGDAHRRGWTGGAAHEYAGQDPGGCSSWTVPVPRLRRRAGHAGSPVGRRREGSCADGARMVL